MSIYTAAVKSVPDKAAAVKVLRKFTELSLGDIMKAVGTSNHIVRWDTEEYPLEMELEEYHEKILAQIAELKDHNFELEFQYSPYEEDGYDDVTYEEVCNLLESELETANQEYD